jgi:hypothetical protein
VFAQEIADPRRLNAEHQDHRGFLKTLKGDVVTGTDFHIVLPEGLNHRETSPRRPVRSR